MLDPESGALEFTEPALRISPTDPEYAQASDLVTNESSRSWSVASCVSGEMRFSVSVYVRDDRLAMVRLTNIDPKFGTSWSEWSQQQEAARQAAHDAWLDRHLGPRRDFAWGTVSSVYDQKAGESTIVIKYHE
jgi:hypothetical protein